MEFYQIEKSAFVSANIHIDVLAAGFHMLFHAGSL
jgi:hypothetical protein